MVYYIVVLGTAGSGKTHLTSTFQGWLEDFGFAVATVNLDPAAEWLPYKPDVDVREYVNAREVMEKYNLGPNGALIASADLLVTKLNEIYDEVSALRANYVVIDTPGQLEVFAFRESGPLILNTLTSDGKTVVLFLIDAVFSMRASGFLSALLLASSINVRLGKSQVNVLTKIDLIEKERVEKLIEYMENYDELITDLLSERQVRILWSTSDLEAILPRLTAYELIPVSSITREGFDNLYAIIQRIVAGGEDYYTEEPSPIL
ncbi:MAG: ATP/GTP-binding protein [Desulfurococcales archaeon]|nr:ATP/GTP-binding protein [Desulfurococcales archaeon]